jgi:hypothetical protein
MKRRRFGGLNRAAANSIVGLGASDDLANDPAAGPADDLLLDRAETLLHGSVDGRSSVTLSYCYGMRTYAGRPSSSIRFSASTAIVTSVVRRRSVRDRRPSPMTRLKRLISASTRARQL